MSNSLRSRDYTVGWICALPLELAAAKAMLDEPHPTPSDHFQNGKDGNTYSFGRVGKHNVVIAVLPAGRYGNNSAATVGTLMSCAFQCLQFCLMVGIGGGIPSKEHDIRLGDVVVSKPGPDHPGVLQHDFGKIGIDGVLKPAGTLNKPPQEVLTAIAALEAYHMMHENKILGFVSELAAKYPRMQATFSYQGAENDILFGSGYSHVEETPTCESCDRSKVLNRKPRSSNIPIVHYGLIASANHVIKNGIVRDKLRVQHNVLCVEMEAAGLMVSTCQINCFGNPCYSRSCFL
jgi:nucleoside phosphorylase